MTAIHVTSTYNVEATINAYFKTALQAFTLPSWLSSPVPVVMNAPVDPAALPAFSFTDISVGAMDAFQGRNAEANTRAMTNLGILEISAWVSRKSNALWHQQLRTMCSMIESAYLDSKGGVVLKDYQSNNTNPSTVAYRIVLNDLDSVVVSPDPNVSVERRRYLIKYQWTVRSTN